VPRARLRKAAPDRQHAPVGGWPGKISPIADRFGVPGEPVAFQGSGSDGAVAAS
jgi:hypothetical protein